MCSSDLFPIGLLRQPKEACGHQILLIESGLPLNKVDRSEFWFPEHGFPLAFMGRNFPIMPRRSDIFPQRVVAGTRRAGLVTTKYQPLSERQLAVADDGAVQVWPDIPDS